MGYDYIDLHVHSLESWVTDNSTMRMITRERKKTHNTRRERERKKEEIKGNKFTERNRISEDRLRARMTPSESKNTEKKKYDCTNKRLAFKRRERQKTVGGERIRLWMICQPHAVNGIINSPIQHSQLSNIKLWEALVMFCGTIVEHKSCDFLHTRKLSIETKGGCWCMTKSSKPSCTFRVYLDILPHSLTLLKIQYAYLLVDHTNIQSHSVIKFMSSLLGSLFASMAQPALHNNQLIIHPIRIYHGT